MQAKSKLLLVLLAAALVAVPALTACGRQDATAAPEAAEIEASEAEEQGKARPLSIAGSTTVQPLAQKLAELFMEKNPDAKVNVQGGGSSVGVKSAAEGVADIGMASREVKESELEEYPDLQPVAIAYDGIAIAVHPDVAVEDLSLDEVQGIFAGEITNWSEVGGPDEMITIVAREEGSGTRAAFEQLAMGDALIAGTAILLPSNGAVRTTVSTTPNSVGFLSFSYLDESVKALAIDGAEPTAANAANGSYPIMRPLNMMTKGAPSGLAEAYLDFALSAEGQAVVEEEGYIAID